MKKTLLFISVILIFSCSSGDSSEPLLNEGNSIEDSNDSGDSSNDGLGEQGESSDENDDLVQILEGQTGIGIFPNSDTPYIFFDDNLFTVIATDDNIDDTIDGIILKDNDSEAYVEFDQKTFLPISVITNNNEQLAFFYSDDLSIVDLAFTKEDGFTEYLQLDTKELNLLFENSGTTGRNSTAEGINAFLKAADFTLSLIGCMVTSAAAIGTVPLGPVLPVLFGGGVVATCGSAFLGFVQYYAEKNPDKINELVKESLIILDLNFAVQDLVDCTIGNSLGITKYKKLNCLSLALTLGKAFTDLLIAIGNTNEFEANLNELINSNTSLGTAHTGPCTSTTMNTTTTVNFDGTSTTTNANDVTDSCLNGGMSFFKDENGAWINGQYFNAYDSGSAFVSITGKTIVITFNYIRSNINFDEAACARVESESMERVSYSFIGSKNELTQVYFEGNFRFNYSFTGSSTTTRTCDPVQSTTSNGNGSTVVTGVAIAN